MHAVAIDEVKQKRRRRRLRVVIAVLAVLSWVGLLVIGILAILAVSYIGDLWCEHPRSDSDYGELSWSIAPPGPVCTWSTANGNFINDEIGPGPSVSLWLIALVVYGAFVFWMVRRALLATLPELPDDVAIVASA